MAAPEGPEKVAGGEAERNHRITGKTRTRRPGGAGEMSGCRRFGGLAAVCVSMWNPGLTGLDF